MHRLVGAWVGLACATLLAGQTPQKPAGLATEWDIAVVLGEISAHAGRLLPALDKVDARSWIAKGASQTYAELLDSSRQQAKAIEDGAKALAADPEKLSAVLEVYFRIEGLETMLGTLEDGLRKYQNPADAQALASQAAENGVNRDRLRTYLTNLASDKERQLEVMDREAQRCRAQLSAQPGAAPPARKKN